MLKRLVEAAGVDYVQWRALLRAYVMIDYGALLGAYGPVAARRAARHLLMQCLFFGMLGVLPAFVIAFARDLFFASTVMVSVIASLVATFVLMQAQTLISPDDYAIVGYRPVSSRTYFAARVTGLLMQTTEIVMLTGYASVAAFLVRSGGSVRTAGAAFAAIVASAIAATVSVAALYGWLLQRMSAIRLQRLVAATAVIGLLTVLSVDTFGYLAFVNVFGDGPISIRVDQTLVRNAWTLLYPGVWFAAYVEVARGAAGTLEWTACALSFAAMAALAFALRGRMATGYADRVAQMTTTPSGVTKPDPAWGLLVNERRALAVLVRHLLRTDVNLQVGMLMQAAMSTALAVFLSTNLPSDPFLSSGRSSNNTAMFMFYLLPMGLRQNFVRSQSSRASWLFFTTPADRAKIVTGMRDLIAICALPLLFVGMAGFLIYAYGHAGHAMIDAALLCSFSYVTLQVDTLFDPRLPFSVPAMDGRRVGLMPRGKWRLIVGCALLFIVFDQSRRLIYRNGWAFAGGVLVLAALIVWLDRLTRRRVAKKIRSAEYFE
jgi:hypothetical protein